MDNKFHIVIRLLSCVLICSLIVFSAICIPARAAAIPAYNPDDFISRVQISDSIKYVTYDFTELTPLVYVTQECTSIDGVQIQADTYESDSLSLLPYGNCFSLDAIFFPFGSYAEQDYPVPTDGGLLDVSGLCAGLPITLSSSYTLDVSVDSRLPIANLDDLTVNCDFGIYKYDKSGNYLGVSYLGAETKVFSDSDLSPWKYTAVNEWYCESDVAYILPFCVFSADSQQLSLWSFDMTEGDFLLTVGIDMEVADSETMTAILDSCHSIETLLGYLNGFVLFFVVVLLCYFAYKFFKIFF